MLNDFVQLCFSNCLLIPIFSELTCHVYRACFDNHCGPGRFLGCIEVKSQQDLLLHALEAPSYTPFSENQWAVVHSLLSNPVICPKAAILQVQFTPHNE